jgi:hypothetical protein
MKGSPSAGNERARVGCQRPPLQGGGGRAPSDSQPDQDEQRGCVGRDRAENRLQVRRGGTFPKTRQARGCHYPDGTVQQAIAGGPPAVRAARRPARGDSATTGRWRAWAVELDHPRPPPSAGGWTPRATGGCYPRTAMTKVEAPCCSCKIHAIRYLQIIPHLARLHVAA